MRILIADDDVTTRMMVSASLSRWGYQPLEADSGDRTWEILTSPDPPLLAILDWTMPGISGPDLCRRLRRELPSSPSYLILLTARNNSRDIVAGLDAGADDFVAKPYQPDELRARIGVGRRVVELRRQLLDANEHLEERVRQRTAEVERLLRRDDELLHHLGHDLRTPLSPLTSLLPILLESEPDADRRELLTLALDGARCIAAISSGVAELCRATDSAIARSPRPLHLRPTVDAAFEQARRCFPDKPRLFRNEVNPNHHVLVDPLHFRRVLDHLITNAVQFTRDDGNGTVTIESLPEPQPQSPPPNPTLTLTVRDNGIGLDPDQITRIFEPFQKADPSRHNRSALGLGLSVARIFVEQHGGRLWAESPGPGAGASFHATWPAAPNPGPSPSPP